MGIQIKQLIEGPVSNVNEIIQRRAMLLHRVILSLAVLVLVILGNLLFSRSGTPALLITLGLSFILTVLLANLSARGMFRFAGTMTLALLFTIITVLILMLGSIRVMATLGYFLIILLSGELFEKRGVVTSTISVCVATLVIIACEQADLLPPPDDTISIQYWINYATFFVISAYLFQFSVSSVRLYNERAMDTLRELNEKQAALLVRDKQYKLLAESTTDVIWLLDLATMKFEYVSPSVFRLRGYTAEEVMSQPVENALTPESGLIMQERLMANLARLQNGQPGIDERMELEQPCKDGTTVWTEVSANFILDGQGNPVQVIGITREITEKRRFIQALRASEEKFSKAFLSSPDSIIISNVADGRYLEVNDSFIKDTGYTREEIIGYTSVEKEIWATAEDREALVNALRENGYVRNMAAQYKRKNGEIRDANISSELIVLENGEKHLLSVVQDVTEQNLAKSRLQASEEKYRALSSELETRVNERTTELAEANRSLEEALNAKDEFLRVMSHELRTPLTGILGLSQALQMGTFGTLTERQLSTVTNIEDNGNRLLRLINSVLDYSNLLGGKTPVELREFSLDTLCANVIRSFASSANAKNQKVSFHANRAVVMVSDEIRLHQAISQLVSNAVKFTPENGELGIKVNAYTDDRLVSIAVWDTGIGIPEKDFGKLFQPFFQLDSSLARKYEGYGLGLALVQLNAKLIGGQLSVASEVGKGSRFTITLPWQEKGL